MVQEVQQQGNWYQTPNEIQGIGNIRRRVKEHTQVTAQFSCSCSMSWECYATTPDGSWSPFEVGTVTITDSYWQMQYKEINGAIRIPRAWIYKITIDAKGATYGTCRHIIKCWGKELFYAVTDSYNTWSAEAVVNLGKYTLLEYGCRLSWSGGMITNPQHETCTITITQL